MDSGENRSSLTAEDLEVSDGFAGYQEHLRRRVMDGSDNASRENGSFYSIAEDPKQSDEDVASSYSSYESIESYGSIQDDTNGGNNQTRHRNKHRAGSRASQKLKHSSRNDPNFPNTQSLPVNTKDTSTHAHSSEPSTPGYNEYPPTQILNQSNIQDKDDDFGNSTRSEGAKPTKKTYFRAFLSSDDTLADRSGNGTTDQPYGGFTKATAVIKPTTSAVNNPAPPEPISDGSVSIQGDYRYNNSENYSSSYGNSNKKDDENTPLLGSSSNDISLAKKSTPIVYYRRWYVLFLFSMASLLQGGAFATFGTITQSAKIVLGWSDADIAFQGLWSNLSYVIFSIPFCWLVERKGLRLSMIVGMFLLTLGFCMRFVSLHAPWALWTVTIGTFFLGGGSVVPYSAMALLSSVWFPPNQRATATSIATLMGFFGSALSFVIGPEVVPELTNTTHAHHHSHHVHSIYPTTSDDHGVLTGHRNSTDVERMRKDMANLFFGEAGISGLILLLVIIYFPAKPPTPPSTSAQEERMELKRGLKSLFRNRPFLMILLSNVLAVGFYGNFAIVLDIDVQPLGVSQKTVGWLGFYGNIGACVGGILVSRFVDKFPRWLKASVIFLESISAVTLVWFLLLVGEFIPYDRASLYITTILPAVVSYSAMPLFYELACEAVYPIGEGVTTLIITMVTNFSGCIFLALFFIPHIGVLWINYVLIISLVLSIVLLLATRITYHRTNLDRLEITVAVPTPPATPPPTTAPPSQPSLLPFRAGSTTYTLSDDSETTKSYPQTQIA